jgi:hypothetical protein
MADEAVALREAAKEHGEDESFVTRRIEGAWDLAKAQFDLALAPLASGGAADAAAWSGERPRHLVVGGRRILENGSLVTADWREIQSEAEDQARDLWTRMESL